MIQTLTKFFILLLISSSVYGQTADKSQCELQQLAIDAALGNSVAQYNLGVEFYRGKIVSQDYGKAATMWRLAGNAGNIEAFNNLGYLTYYGKGVKQDYAEGIKLWRIAAEKGFAESQAHIGNAYYDGRFLKQDFVEAYAWAWTSKHFAQQLNDEILAADIKKMAEELLLKSKKNLSNAQIVEAEKRAANYIAKYSSK